jgi:hypothetical protein
VTPLRVIVEHRKRKTAFAPSNFLVSASGRRVASCLPAQDIAGILEGWRKISV